MTDVPLYLVKGYETGIVENSTTQVVLPLGSGFRGNPIKIKKLFKKNGVLVGYCDIEYEPIGGKTLNSKLESLKTADNGKQISIYQNLPEIEGLFGSLRAAETKEELNWVVEGLKGFGINDPNLTTMDNSEDGADNLETKISALREIVDEEVRKSLEYVDAILLGEIQNLESIRCNKKIFYRGGAYPDCNDGALQYAEIFHYGEKDKSAPDELRISRIEDKNKKEIGYRYYGRNYKDISLDSNYFSVVENERGMLSPLSVGRDMNTRQVQFDVVSDIFHERYKDKRGYEIHGDHRKSLAFSAISNTQGSDYVEVIAPGKSLREKIEQCEDVDGAKYETYFNPSNKESLETFFKRTSKDFGIIGSGNKKIFVVPVVLDEHATVLLYNKIQNSQNLLATLVDTSGAHYYNYGFFGGGIRPREDLFGQTLSKNIKSAIENSGIQANGTCQFWSDAITKVISNPENRYNSEEAINEGFKSGKILLQAAIEVGRIFDEDITQPTIKRFDTNTNQEENDQYIIFTLKTGEKFGINKFFAINKFVDINSLVVKLENSNGVLGADGMNLKAQFGEEFRKHRIFSEKESEIYWLMEAKKRGKEAGETLGKLISPKSLAVQNKMVCLERIKEIDRELSITKSKDTKALLSEKKEMEKKVVGYDLTIKSIDEIFLMREKKDGIDEKQMNEAAMIEHLNNLRERIKNNASIDEEDSVEKRHSSKSGELYKNVKLYETINRKYHKLKKESPFVGKILLQTQLNAPSESISPSQILSESTQPLPDTGNESLIALNQREKANNPVYREAEDSSLHKEIEDKIRDIFTQEVTDGEAEEKTAKETPQHMQQKQPSSVPLLETTTERARHTQNAQDIQDKNPAPNVPERSPFSKTKQSNGAEAATQKTEVEKLKEKRAKETVQGRSV
jgi:hypothetical protein